MDSLETLSVKVKNYKCFGEEEQGFEKLLPVNIIIGRNNSGKSTLLEIIAHTVEEKTVFENQLHFKRQGTPEIILTHTLSAGELQSVFSKGVNGTLIIGGGSDWDRAKQWVGSDLKWKLGAQNNSNTFINLTPPFIIRNNKEAEYNAKIARAKINPLKGKIFKRLFAERDIVPESVMPVNVAGNGQGATNALQCFINEASLPSDLVEKVLLVELNKIFEPDSAFTRIVAQHLTNEKWEIYLEETYKERIALSHTGSGLKTVLLVLIFLYLTPHLENKQLRDYIFAFEELENNLHPALLRRLLFYLREIAIKHGCVFLFTTHSNVTIDLFSRDDKAQIIHVTHDGEKAEARTVKTYVDNKGILDNLDVRASDLLQSNGIIWVEGPSDRLYLSRWI